MSMSMSMHVYMVFSTHYILEQSGGFLVCSVNANEGIMHTLFARIARFRIREYWVL